MSKQQQTTRSFQLSISQKRTADTSEPDAINRFKVTNTSFTELPALVTQHNYSLIHWAKNPVITGQFTRSRSGENFESASGVMIDVDDGLSIDEAEAKLKSKNLNYGLVTSKSHTPPHPKYHILLPFEEPLTSRALYESVATTVIEQIFPESDQAVKDAARFFFGSPPECDIRTYQDGHWLDPYDILKSEWTPHADLAIRTADDAEVLLGDIQEKTPCYCPFPGHEDTNPSAVVFQPMFGLHTIYCSSCDMTWQEVKDQTYWSSQNDPYYLIGNSVYDIGLQHDHFFMEKLHDRKYFLNVRAKTAEDQEAAMTHLVTEHSMRHLHQVRVQGAIDADASSYEVRSARGIIDVHIAPIAEDRQDNQFIEDYLEETFGQHKAFIKEYLAVYTYTNYIRLPFLVLYGDRGTGKTLFAEFVGAIYEPLKFYWHGDESNFSYEAEHKLLIVEENVIEKKSQYKKLKEYGGSRDIQVHKKYQDPYQVPNNMNVIMLSNEEIPLYVERRELPTDVKNNQFFVYRMPTLSGPIDPQFQDKLRARLGHYIRTELHQVFQILDLSKSRYSIEVPITTEETALFQNNRTNISADAEMVMERLLRSYATKFGPDTPEQALLQEGWLLNSLLEQANRTGTHDNMILKELKKEGVITSLNTTRKYKKVNGQKRRGENYPLSDEWRDKFGEEYDTNIHLPLGPLFDE